MKTITTGKGEFLFVPLPNGAINVKLASDTGYLSWNFDNSRGTFYPLPPGKYTYLFTTDNVTEEDAEKVVKEYRDFNGFLGWKNYEPDPHPLDENFEKPLRSFQSLLKANGIEGNNAVIKNENKV